MNEQTPAPWIAIVGRPNVGKSTLFNRYAGRRRAIVDDIPGLTRDRIIQSVDVDGRRVLLVDTAGFEPAATGTLGEAVQAQAREAVRGADAILFVVDGSAGLLPEDEAIAKELRRSDRPVALLVNKIDTPRQEARVGEDIAQEQPLAPARMADHQINPQPLVVQRFNPSCHGFCSEHLVLNVARPVVARCH